MSRGPSWMQVAHVIKFKAGSSPYITSCQQYLYAGCYSRPKEITDNINGPTTFTRMLLVYSTQTKNISIYAMWTYPHHVNNASRLLSIAILDNAPTSQPPPKQQRERVQRSPETEPGLSARQSSEVTSARAPVHRCPYRTYRRSTPRNVLLPLSACEACRSAAVVFAVSKHIARMRENRRFYKHPPLPNECHSSSLFNVK